MKRLAVLVAVIMIAGLLTGCDFLDWVFGEKLTIPEVDGIVSIGEWDDATEIPVGDYYETFYDMGIVKVLATTDYLYVLFDIKDSTDARLGDGRIDDNLGININPTDGGPWGMPCDLIFATGLYLSQGSQDWISSGLTDDYETKWSVNGTQYDIPDDLDTVTLYSEDMRVSEWKVPLATISPASGDVLKVGGHVNIEISYRFPTGLEWADASTFVSIIVY